MLSSMTSTMKITMTLSQINSAPPPASPRAHSFVSWSWWISWLVARLLERPGKVPCCWKWNRAPNWQCWSHVSNLYQRHKQNEYSDYIQTIKMKTFIYTTCCMYFSSSLFPAAGVIIPGNWKPTFDQFGVGKVVPSATGGCAFPARFGKTPPDLAAAAIRRDCCCWNIAICCWWIANGDTILDCKANKGNY